MFREVCNKSGEWKVKEQFPYLLQTMAIDLQETYDQAVEVSDTKPTEAIKLYEQIIANEGIPTRSLVEASTLP